MIPWLFAAIALGLATAFVAGAKGRSFLPWLVYGTFVGIVALPHALFLRRDPVADDDGAECRDMRDTPPEFTGSWAQNWMRGDSGTAAPRRAAMAARGSRRADEVPAVWSDDAFARLVGDESPQAESGPAAAGRPSSGTGLDQPSPAARRPAPETASRPVPESAHRHAPERAHRPTPEREDLPGFAPLPLRRDGPEAGFTPRDEPPEGVRHLPEAGQVNGNRQPRRDFLDLVRDIQEGRGQGGRGDEYVRDDEDDDAPFAAARKGYDADRAEPRFESSLGGQATGGHSGDRYGDDRFDGDHYFDPEREEDVWMARRLAPDPIPSRGVYEDGDRRRWGRGNLLSYAFAAVCVVLAVALVWPRPPAGPAPDTTASIPATPAPKGPSPDASAGAAPDTAREATPFVPPSLHAGDALSGSESTVSRSFVPPPPPPDTGAARAGEEMAKGDDASRPEPETAPQGGGTAFGTPPRPPKDRPAVTAAPSSDVARLEAGPPPSPRSESPPGTPATKAVPKAPTPKAAPKGTAKATPEKRAVNPGAPPSSTDTGESITAVGQMVLLVQAELKKRGYEPGEVNGRAGEQTREAIRQFKRREGLKADSVIDDELFQKLGIVGRRLHPFASSSR